MDQNAYSKIFDAIKSILGNNINLVGQDFAQRFVDDYNPTLNQQTYTNANNLFNWLLEQARRANQNSTLTDEQLFQLLGSFISDVFKLYQQQNNRGSSGAFNSGGGGFGGYNTGYNRGGGFSSGGNMFGQPQRPSPGSHLSDETTMSRPAPSMGGFAPASVADTPKPDVQAPIITPTSFMSYSVNPLDDAGNGDSFGDVKRHPDWGPTPALDNRILVTSRQEVKNQNGRFVIQKIRAQHQLILNDEMDVVKDFFAIVPDALLGNPFTVIINYNHLEKIAVPTEDFLELRRKCVEAIKNNPQALLHRTLLEVLGTMQVGPWKAVTTYLTKHINRALYLSARLSSNIKPFIELDTFDDVNDLLSSSFQNDLTRLPEGRLSLERIVGSAIWNALVLNSDVMFGDGVIPTNAMQTSPAFPYSMEGVYPSKSAIPVPSEAMADQFMERLQSEELDHHSYILSRRSVVITNTLGKAILSNVKTEMTRFENVIGSLLTPLSIPYNQVKADSRDGDSHVEPYINEESASDQLEKYYDNPEQFTQDFVDRNERKQLIFPVDQTIFAIQYGVDPEEYLMALDVFNTVDPAVSQNQVLLAKKTISTITTTA